jgi:putative acetyltransferase
MIIKPDDLSGTAIRALIQLHLDNMAEISPPESCHALAIDSLKSPHISVWSAWDNDELMGCGALMALDATHGEIKSMRTATAHLQKGVAAAILEHILHVAKERSYTRLSLETGSADEFIPARKLYEKYGFEECGPFADYTLDPLSTFMTKVL